MLVYSIFLSFTFTICKIKWYPLPCLGTWKMFKSKHIKLPASVADQYLLVLALHPHSHLTPHSSPWNPVSRNDRFLVLQKCARKRQTVAQFSSEIVFSKSVWCSWNLSAIISSSPPRLTQNRQEKDTGTNSTPHQKAGRCREQARFMREVWSAAKAWGLKASVQVNGCHGSHAGQYSQLQKYAETGNSSLPSISEV